MSKIKAVKIFNFCAAHRILGHEGKCANLHGHNYEAHIYFEGKELDSLNRVIDFGVVKHFIGEWINKYWDHNSIIFKDDELLVNALRNIDNKKDIFIYPENPTAESMANYLLYLTCPTVLTRNKIFNVKATKVRLYETKNCYVEVEK